jgi:hypothetical protein
MNTFIKSLDFLGKSKYFTINSQGKFKTISGGFLTIFISISFFALFILLGDDLIYKKNPKGYFQTKPNLKTHSNITEFEFLVGIQMSNFNGEIFEINEYLHPIFKLTNYYHLKNGSTIKKEKEIPYITCDKYNKKNNYDRSNFDLSKFICPDISNIIDEKIGGNFYKRQNSTEITFHLSLCDHNKKNCKDGNKFKELTQKDLILLNILNPEINYMVDDYENPFQTSLKISRIFINFYSYVLYDILFDDHLLDDDKGFFFESKTEYNILSTIDKFSTKDIKSFQSKSEIENLDKMTEKELNFLILYISKIGRLRYYNRSYLKFSTVLANVASLMKTFISLIGLVYSYFNEFRFNTYLCNRLIFVVDDDNLNLNEKDIKSSNLKRSEINKEIIDFSNNKLKIEEEDYYNIKSLPIENKNINLRLEKVDINEIYKKNKLIIDIKNEEESAKIELENISNRGLFRKETKKKLKNLSPKNKNNDLISYEINSKIDISLNKFNEYKNKIIFNLYNTLFPKKNQKIIRINEIFDFYSNKLNEKFDIFYYFKLDKKTDVLQRYLFNKQEIDIIELLSKKNYKMNFKNFKKKNDINNEEINKKILNYFLLTESNSKKEKLLEIFLK